MNWCAALHAAGRHGVPREGGLGLRPAAALHRERHGGGRPDQQLYEFGEGKPAPKGTRLEVVGRWDNSTANRYNPDPTKDVKWGDKSWEEMLLSMVTLSIDPDTDVTTILEKPARRGPAPAPAR